MSCQSLEGPSEAVFRSVFKVFVVSSIYYIV
jgi:hypothetical protein